MTDESDIGQEAAPFEPQPADLGGCGKPAVIGCLAILVVVGVLLAVFLFKARDMLDWALAQYQTTVVANLAEEVSEDERARLDAAFDRARAAIRENRLQPDSVQRLQRFMSNPPRKDQPLDAEAVRELTEVLEGLDEGPVSRSDPALPRERQRAPAAVTDAGV